MGDNLAAVDSGPVALLKALPPVAKRRCAILDDGTLKCWGSNAAGQLGQGEYAQFAARQAGTRRQPAKRFDVGGGRTTRKTGRVAGTICGPVLDDTSLKCWGLNVMVQLVWKDMDTRGDGCE